MLGDNIKRIRKERGFTQEELAVRLHVVRQTVSKWEKNLSVPDAELLQRLSQELDVSVSELLGGESDREGAEQRQAIVEQLSRINEQLAVQNRRARRIWTVLGVLLAALIVLPLLGAAIFSAVPGRSLAEGVILSDDSPHSYADVEAAFEAVQTFFRRQCRDCTLDTLVYDESEIPPAADTMVISARFQTGEHPRPETLQANQTVSWNVTLIREDGGWTVTNWEAP